MNQNLRTIKKACDARFKENSNALQQMIDGNPLQKEANTLGDLLSGGIGALTSGQGIVGKMGAGEVAFAASGLYDDLTDNLPKYIQQAGGTIQGITAFFKDNWPRLLAVFGGMVVQALAASGPGPEGAAQPQSGEAAPGEQFGVQNVFPLMKQLAPMVKGLAASNQSLFQKLGAASEEIGADNLAYDFHRLNLMNKESKFFDIDGENMFSEDSMRQMKVLADKSYLEASALLGDLLDDATILRQDGSHIYVASVNGDLKKYSTKLVLASDFGGELASGLAGAATGFADKGWMNALGKMLFMSQMTTLANKCAEEVRDMKNNKDTILQAIGDFLKRNIMTIALAIGGVAMGMKAHQTAPKPAQVSTKPVQQPATPAQTQPAPQTPVNE